MPELVWIHVIADTFIALAYYSIPVMLVYFVRTRRDVPFDWIFWMFGTFIIACGTTHLMEVWTLWYPTYWLSGLFKAITAFVSIFTALELVLLLPKALALPSSVQLEATNIALLNEVIQHKRTEEALGKVLDELEIRVQERTSELIRINESLQAEITERRRVEEALRESEQRFRLMADAVPVMIWESGTDKLCNYLNKVWLEFTGQTIIQAMGNDQYFYIHPEDRQFSLQTYNNAFDAQQEFTIEYRLLRFDGEYRWILNTGIPRFTLDARFVGYIGSGVDISDRKQAEEQIQASLVEKEVLLKEIYHRVKNNLQVISSLLNLQSEYIEDKNYLEIFRQSQRRIESMALIHEKLYQAKDLAMIDFGEYIRDLVVSLFSSYEVNTDAIALTINIDDVFLGLDVAIPCGLIVNELVYNSLKYAFPTNNFGEIRIFLISNNEHQFTLSVSDNGISLPAGFDIKNTTTLGLQLVDALTHQLSGNLELNCSCGLEIKIVFPALGKI